MVTYEECSILLNSNGTVYINEAYLKDHLDNVRGGYYWAGSLKTQQVNSYYPFGMNIKGLTANGSATYKPNEYLYNGKMMQEEMGLNLLDYGARFYDAVLGRWHTVDPACEEGGQESWTNFQYALNSPVKNIDPDGRFVGTLIGTIVGGVVGAVDAYKSNKDILAGATEGAVSGMIAGAAVDFTVATGGAGGVIIAAAVVGGAGGAFIGDVTGQAISNYRSGDNISNSLKNVKIDEKTANKVAIGALTGFVGGTAGVIAGKAINAFELSTKAVQATMSGNITSTAKTLTNMGANVKTVSTATNKITTGMGSVGKATANSVAKGSAMAAFATASIEKMVDKKMVSVKPF